MADDAPSPALPQSSTGSKFPIGDGERCPTVSNPYCWTSFSMQHVKQEGRIYHTKRKLPLTKACRWEQLQCCRKAKPARRSTQAAVRVAATCVNGMKLQWHNVFMKNHQQREADQLVPLLKVSRLVTADHQTKLTRIIKKGNRCNVSGLPESTKIF